MESILYKNETYEFILKELKGEGQTGAEITRRSLQDGEEIVLFSYYWPAQLMVEVEMGECSLREDGILCWQDCWQAICPLFSESKYLLS